jgi:hypothetical protein
MPTGTTTDGEEEENSNNGASPHYSQYTSFLLFILRPTAAEEHEVDNTVQVSKTRKHMV